MLQYEDEISMFMKACHEGVGLAIKEGTYLRYLTTESLAWSKTSGQLEEEVNGHPAITAAPWDPIYGA